MNGTTTLGSNLIYNYAAVPSTSANAIGYVITGTNANLTTVTSTNQGYYNITNLPIGVYILMGNLTVGYVTSAQNVQVSIRSPGFSNVLPHGTSYGSTSSTGNVTINV